jgi:2-haloalkanoic acid dehalogenase type II
LRALLEVPVFEALLLDFYGTVVHEDDDVVASICRVIADSSAGGVGPSDIGRVWWASFSELCMASHGDRFATQRELEHRSLVSTVERFGATCDPEVLSTRMFEHWARSPLFDDAQAFLAAADLPVVVLSNIDRRDIESCLDVHRLRFDTVVTSEDVRAYKPHAAMFEAGLQATGVTDRRRVLHIGDSFTSDVCGANAAGIPVAWLNRSLKPKGTDGHPDHVAATLSDLLPLLEQHS